MAVGVTTLFASMFAYGVWELLGSHAFSGLTLFVVAWFVPAPAFGWLAFRCRWAKPRTAVAACVLTLAVGIVPYLVGRTLQGVVQTSKRKTVLFRQITAAMDRYFLENGTAVVEYDDLIGPTRYIKHQSLADGEDFRSMFPLYDFTPTLSVRMSDGYVVSDIRYGEGDDARVHFAPAEPFYPSGKGPPADGVHQRVLPGGIRLEVTYRDGVPHGPFRAYRPDGRHRGQEQYAVT